MRTWYPERKKFAEHRLKVSDIHELYIEECGNPNGRPVIWLHGGPGGGIGAAHGRAFDPEFYRIILFDQRGAGNSTPYAEIKENTTQDLIGDIEKIRDYLKIDKWLVAGRSWGTTLGLLYAQAYPERVRALHMSAIFLCDKASVNWIMQQGASYIYPEAWEDYVSLIPVNERNDMVAAYKKRMFGNDEKLAVEAAKRWSNWEANTVSVLPDESIISHFNSDKVMLALARLECHYLSNGAFVKDAQIIMDAHKIAHIPTKIIHGRYDMDCTFDNAWRLHKALPKSELFEIRLGGHAANDAITIDAQVRAADDLKQYCE